MIGAWLLLSSAHALDLEEARQRALSEAIGVERAQAEADAAAGEASAWVGRSLPTVSAEATMNAGGGQTAFGFDRPTFAFFGIGVRGSWTVVDPSTWAAATAARRTARGQRAMLQWARVTARRDATVAYAQALAAEQVAEALQLAADDAAEGSEAVSQRVTAGLRPPADATAARAEALTVAAQATEARGQVAATCAALQGLLDLEVTGTCALEPVEDWGTPGEATGVHPAVVASEEALDAARASRSSALWAHAPTASASGNATEFLGVGVGWSANATVSVPLTGVTSGPGEVRAASAAQRRAVAELDNQERALAVSLVSAQGALDAAQAGLQARQEALSAAEEAWSQVDQRYQAGLAPIADWLTARRGLQTARVELARARAAVGVAVAELEAARGVAP